MQITVELPSVLPNGWAGISSVKHATLRDSAELICISMMVTVDLVGICAVASNPRLLQGIRGLLRDSGAVCVWDESKDVTAEKWTTKLTFPY
uniref:Uncharacterized protein n=1 Tax=Rhipicephalus zambeziensis TaxID=60191 RepID=A0A224Y6B4_9ACAR